MIDDFINFSKARFAVKSWAGQLWRKFWGWHPMYWLRCHTFTRYHIINVSGYDDYTWGWIDRDHVMFIACFKLLEEYMEKEKPHEIICWTEDDFSMNAWNEMFELYWWWKFGRKMEFDACHEFYSQHQKTPIPFPEPEPGALTVPINDWLDSHWDSKESTKIWMDWHFALDEKDQTQLERLVKIRRAMWT